jgi:hypothetical protein
MTALEIIFAFLFFPSHPELYFTYSFSTGTKEEIQTLYEEETLSQA